MSAQTWGTPELGHYFVRHAGHELEVRRVPKSGKGSEREKQYQVIVSGIFADMAWSTSEAKTKAIRIAERTHKGEPILTFSEREKLRSEPASTADKPATVVSTREAPPAKKVLEPYDLGEEHAINHPMRSMAEVISGLSMEAPSHLAEAAELFRADPCGCPAQAGVSFTIRGNLDMDATNALTTIRAAVELLREHGGVECDVIVPNRIKL